MSKRILVFGGKGFLGNPLVSQLSGLGHDVYSASRAEAGLSSARHVQLDIRDAEKVIEALETLSPQWIINAAAYGVQYGQSDEVLAHSINVEAAKSLCEAAIGNMSVERYLHIGSCFEYGDQAGPISEDTVPSPATPYARTKAEGTAEVVRLAGQSDKSVVVARLFSLWGEQEPEERLFSSVVRAAQTNSSVDLTPCTQLRDYSHVKDVVNQIIGLLTHTEFGRDKVLNIASGDARSLREYLVSINQAFDNQAQLNFGARPFRENEMMSLIADTQKLDRYNLKLCESFEARCAAWRRTYI